MKLSLESIRTEKLILLEALSGSRAYGLATETSDTDYKGVFIAPRNLLFGLSYPNQINNESNDIAFYEVGRFVELLLKNNPNILELLATPTQALIYRHSLLERLPTSLFLSKLCKESFAGYAMTQIRKARGLNKKILNPMNKERKSILDFCWIMEGQGAVDVQSWLKARGIDQRECGLVNLPHLRDLYALFHEQGMDFRGIMPKNNSNEVSVSSVPKGMQPLAYLSFNKEGYQRYCKDYKNYWEWVDKRNEARYENTLSHGKNYDAKNLMHTFRLLDMAAEIAQFGEIRVWRDNRDFYLKIKRGEYDYENLVEEAENRIPEIEELYERSPLPEAPDPGLAEKLLIEIREEFYGS